MQLEPELKEYILENLDMLDDGEYSEFYEFLEMYSSVIYKSIGGHGVISKITQFLLSCGIHPDEHMNKLPLEFLSHAQIKEYSIAEGVTKIERNAFWGSSIRKVVLPNSLQEMEESVFRECPNLETVVFGNNLTYVSTYCFYKCSSLKHITIPDSLDYVPFGFVSNCKNLESITLHENITEIGPFALAECPNLKRINFRGTKGKWNRIHKGTDWNKQTKGYELVCDYTGV